MRLRIVALGQRMPSWVAQAVAEYAKRLPRETPLDVIELKPAARDRGRTVVQMLADERRAIAAACADAIVVALDERGDAWTTRDLAERLSRWRADGRDVAFVIGSADGLDPSFKAGASAVVALSAMTLPHGLARVILAEQLYRATSILAGHPYHRE